MAVLLLSVFAVCTVASAYGAGLEDISLGRCVDNKKDINNFSMVEFLGRWYENATLDRLPLTPGRCAAVEYTVKLADDTVNVRQTEIVDDKEVQYNSTLFRINLIDYYRYFTLYEDTKGLPYEPDLKLLFKLLGTDYTCWAVIYSCIGEPEIYKEIVTVLLRNRDESCLNETTNKAVEKLIQEVLERDFLTEFSFNNHKDCPSVQLVSLGGEPESDETETEEPSTEEHEKTPANDEKKTTSEKEEKKEKTAGGEKTETKKAEEPKDEKTETKKAEEPKDEKTETKKAEEPKDEKTETKKAEEPKDEKTEPKKAEEPNTKKTEPEKSEEQKGEETEPAKAGEQKTEKTEGEQQTTEKPRKQRKKAAKAEAENKPTA